MAIAIKTFYRTGNITPQCHTAIRIVNALAATACSVAAQLDTVAVAGERGGAVEILLNPQMVAGIAGFPSPTLCQDYIKIGLEQIPCVIGIAPSTATDEAIAFAVVHLACKTIRIRAVVGIIIAVMV